MPTTTLPRTSESQPATRTKRADLFAKFEHLDRQRDALHLAMRIMRLLNSASAGVAEIALEIACTAIRTQDAANGEPPVPAANAQVDVR